MQKTVQFLIYLVCADVTGAYINTEYESDVDEETRQFILDQNTETRKLFNDAISSLHDKLAKHLEHLGDTISSISSSQNENPSKLLVENITELMENQLTGIVSKQNETEKKFESVFKSLLQKMDKVNQHLSETSELRNEIDNKLIYLFTHNRYLKLPDSFMPTESSFVLDATKLIHNRGAIFFDGIEMASSKRRFWVLEKAGTVTFILDENKLKPDARLTISGLKTAAYDSLNSTDYLDEAYIDSSTSNGAEFTVSGVMVLVTMSRPTEPELGLVSSFALSFIRTQNENVLPPWRIIHPTTFALGEGKQEVSFPHNNANDYSNQANHFMIISQRSGRAFNLWQTYIDTESNNDYYRVFSIQDNTNKTGFVSSARGTGRLGPIYRHLGRHSTAIVFFQSDQTEQGKGYELKID